MEKKALGKAKTNTKMTKLTVICTLLDDYHASASVVVLRVSDIPFSMTEISPCELGYMPIKGWTKLNT